MCIDSEHSKLSVGLCEALLQLGVQMSWEGGNHSPRHGLGWENGRCGRKLNIQEPARPFDAAETDGPGC